MKASKAIFNFNHIDNNLTETEISKLKALYKYYDKRYWLFKMTYKYFRKMELACKIGSVGLIATGTIVGAATLNPIVLGTISGAGLILSAFTEAKNYKRKIEMCKFAYTSYEEILTDIRSFLRGLEFDDERFLDYIKVVEEIITDMCHYTTSLRINTTNCLQLRIERIPYKVNCVMPVIFIH